MNSFENTWRDRHFLVGNAYGLNVIVMLTVQTVAFYAYLLLPIEEREKVEKLIISYQRKIQWKSSKNSAALIIEKICGLLNPNQEISWLNYLLDKCCYRNSFHGDFGLNHVFAVIFLPILVSSITGQKKYYVSIAGAHDENWGEKHSLFQILQIHREILEWHETNGETEVNPIFRFGEDFVQKATTQTARDSSVVSDALEDYHNVQLNYGRTK